MSTDFDMDIPWAKYLEKNNNSTSSTDFMFFRVILDNLVSLPRKFLG